MSDAFEALLEGLVPGAGRQSAEHVVAPDFPRELGLEPLGLIARGGTGWVFRARDPVLGREVAVKVARPDQGASAREAVLAEARRTAALGHPSVLPVHRMTVAGGLVCVEYRLAPRTTLEALLGDPERLVERDVLGRLVLLRGPARALQRAHTAGLVHGDVHPANLVVGDDDAVYLLDWAGPPPATEARQLSGSAGHAAPEVLRGDPPGPPADVFALGAVAWELCAGRPMRPRQRGEDLGSYVARWRDRPAPPLPEGCAVPEGVTALFAGALDPDPARRVDAAGFAVLLDDALSGAAERSARDARGASLLAAARETLARYAELGIRRDDERQVVGVTAARVPGHAPAAAKAALWDAEDRLEQLELERGLVWLDAVQQAVRAGAFGEDDREAREMVAELWSVRMEDMASRGLPREVALAAYEVGVYDPHHRGAALRAPCRLSLTALTAVPVSLTVSRLVPRGRALVEEEHAHAILPLAELSMPPGRWMVTARAEGFAPVRYLVALGRAEHHVGQVRLYRPDEVGDGFVQIAASPFQLGGDVEARQALPRCRPLLADRFMMRLPVTAQAYLEFLEDLPLDEARRRAPGGRGPAGELCPWWAPQDGRWLLPAGWDPRWPVVGVDAQDAAAYAAWWSARHGRPARLPTEEEWEKAARGVDGRAWPWGDRFDPILAHMRSSRPGSPGLAPVGTFPSDRSPYGCQDMAGGVREWTASWLDHQLVVVRGGSWADDAADLRCAARSGVSPDHRGATVGFRLVSEVPAQCVVDG